MSFCTPPGLLRQFCQKRQYLIVQALGVSSQCVCSTRVVAFSACTDLEAKKILRLAIMSTKVICVRDRSFKVSFDEVNTV